MGSVVVILAPQIAQRAAFKCDIMGARGLNSYGCFCFIWLCAISSCRAIICSYAPETISCLPHESLKLSTSEHILRLATTSSVSNSPKLEFTVMHLRLFPETEFVRLSTSVNCYWSLRHHCLEISPSGSGCSKPELPVCNVIHFSELRLKLATSEFGVSHNRQYVRFSKSVNCVWSSPHKSLKLSTSEHVFRLGQEPACRI